MAGHSKWAGIKHKKGALDKKRGKLFSKLAKVIIIAARDGGGDLSANARLRLAVDKAKASNMPNANIDRAIKRGTGEIEGAQYVDLVYEGYGPAQVAVVVEILTDNKNRTASELRKLFERKNANLGSPGSVSWMFDTKGLIIIPSAAIGEDELMMLALEAGAEDVRREGDTFEVVTTPETFSDVQAAVEAKNLAPASAEVTRIPSSTVAITDEKDARKVLDFIETLEDHDDVQTVHANFDIPDELLEAISDSEV